MDELEKIYMADDAIAGAEVYKPVTDWATDTLKQPFDGPLINVKPTGFAMDNEGYPGVQAWRRRFPENTGLSDNEAICRGLAPSVKARDAGGNVSVKPPAFSGRQGLFGTTDEPCFKQAGQEKFQQDFTHTMSEGADWINRGGAAIQSSINPAENRNWQETPSMQLGKTFEAQPFKRDYGVPRNQEFSIEKNYKPGLAKDLSDYLQDPAYGQAGQKASADLKNSYVSTHSMVNGKALWNRLKNDFGVERAGQIINKLGYFSGVKGNPTFSGNEMLRFSPSEAERAMEKMEQENRYRDLPENPAYNAHGVDFGSQLAPKDKPLSLRPTYDEYGYDYAAGPDPRQYGVPKNTRFSTSGQYGPELAEDISRIVSDPVYGEEGAKLAMGLRNSIRGGEAQISGKGLYYVLADTFGQDRAHEIINRLDYFSGVDGFAWAEEKSGKGQTLDFDSRPGEGYPALFR